VSLLVYAHNDPIEVLVELINEAARPRMSGGSCGRQSR